MAEAITSLWFPAARPQCANLLAALPFSVGAPFAYSSATIALSAFPVTHELLAAMLGVRRQSVSVVAGTLQKAGFIAYRHGVIRVVDRDGLEAASCECYGVTETLYD